ncbi:MAG: alpha/beta hydrolase [Prevotellaceae bacterium]|nr:alpha/beta hydrolase [Prevotellaceae bacterium]
MKRIFLSIIVLMTAAITASAQKPFDITLNRTDNDSSTIRVFLPKKNIATGRAVVVCPGGGYSHLAMEHEGYDWADFFGRMGVATIVLKYKMPHGNHLIPIGDAEQAIKAVRAHAQEWGINPNDVGIMGSSAGGHLASTISTHSTGDSAPNFQILFYPVVSMDSNVSHGGSHDNFLGKNPKKEMELEYSNALKVTPQTPRAFIVLASDDRSVKPQNSTEYYQALCNNKVPAMIVAYPTGGHGFGYRPSFIYHSQMLTELAAWLRSF